MPIPTAQLQTWTHQGAIVTSQATHQSIRSALRAPTSPVRHLVASGDVEIRVQGSYRNDTNIRGDSDVDVVVELRTTFASNLAPTDRQYLGQLPATYFWDDFRRDVATALQNYYGIPAIDLNGNKALKLRAAPGRLAADIIPCITYKVYSNFVLVHEGITFWTQRERRQVINFPQFHYQNGIAKHSANQTNGWYKPTVRLFKNARTYLIDRRTLSADVGPSYFLESILYNVPNTYFGSNLENSVPGILNWVWSSCAPVALVCQNAQTRLFGGSPEQWSLPKAQQLFGALIKLWNEW
jgi:hypothetical protein